jgi:hypothetical protein
MIDPKIAAVAGAAAAEQRGVAAPGTAQNLLEEVTVVGTRNTDAISTDATSVGELKFLEAGEKSKTTVFSFPLDIENGNLPYVIFYVYDTSTEPISGVVSRVGESRDNRTYSIKQGTGAVIGPVASGTKVLDDLTFNIGSAAGKTVVDAIDNITGLKAEGKSISSILKDRFDGFSLQRNINFIRESIVLFMPDSLQANYEHNYDEISVTATLGAAGMLAQAISDKAGGAANAMDPYIMEAAAGVLGAAVPGLQSSQELTNLLLFGTTGRAVNPQMEVLYNSPRLRSFIFDFRLVPRNQKEAIRIKDIVNKLKYFSAPQIQAETSGRYYTPPARFLLEFHHRGDANPYLFRTKFCVLESISLDYAPNGYASHYDGAPVETRMQLTFKETTMISRDDIQMSGVSY